MYFYIFGSQNTSDTLNSTEAYNLDNIQDSLHLEKILCVSEIGFKQNFANMFCGKAKNRFNFKSA